MVHVPTGAEQVIGAFQGHGDIDDGFVVQKGIYPCRLIFLITRCALHRVGLVGIVVEKEAEVSGLALAHRDSRPARRPKSWSGQRIITPVYQSVAREAKRGSALSFR